jgi:hypothetical protein
VGRKYEAVLEQRRIVDAAKRGYGSGVTVDFSHDPFAPSSAPQWRMRPLKTAQSFAPRAFDPGDLIRDLRFAGHRFPATLSPSFSGFWMRGQE